MFATFTKLIAGSAFTAVLAVPQLASAGHGCTCPSRTYAPAHVGAHHTPTPPGTSAVVAPAPSDQPPVAPGPVVRRFSYEPGTEGAVQDFSAASVYRPAPAFRSAARQFRSSGMRSLSGFGGGLTGGARLNPGHGNR